MKLSNKYKWRDKDYTWIFEPIKTSPIIISIPHDRCFCSYDFFGFFESRKMGVIGRDKNVWPIVRDILLVVEVGVVRGCFPRQFVDYNRPLIKNEDEKYEVAIADKSLQYVYDVYHDSISRLIKKAISRFGKKKCLLLDFHGFKNQPDYGNYDIIIGTSNRLSVNSEIDKRFHSFMYKRGYKVFLPGSMPIRSVDNDKYSGRFTVINYSKKFDIDAMQIEISRKFRTAKGKKIREKLSADVADFLKKEFEL